MAEVFFLSNGKIYAHKDGYTTYYPSQAVDKYCRNIMDIYKYKEWKTSGQGAKFMGLAEPSAESLAIHAQVEAIHLADQGDLLYAASLDDSCGLYIKDAQEAESPDRFVLRRQDMNLYHFDYNEADKQIIASVSDGPIERHLALCHEDKGDLTMLTEGESLDIMPSFSRQNSSLVFFSSAGLYFQPQRQAAQLSAYAINCLNLQSGEIQEIIADPAYDFFHARQDEQGQLFCLRRRKQQNKVSGRAFLDILLIPVRLLKAVFSWLNFFTQRYTGESLRKNTGGFNPARQQQKSPEDIFIEGNLINARRSLQENTKQGEKFPGVAPRSWELIRLGPQNQIISIKHGVLDYNFDGKGGFIYSNGLDIIRLTEDGREERICAADLATGLTMTYA